MSWNPHALAAILAYPDVFADHSAFGTGINFSDPSTGKHLLFAADYFDASVERLCLPSLRITSAREVEGTLEIIINPATFFTGSGLHPASTISTATVTTFPIFPRPISILTESCAPRWHRARQGCVSCSCAGRTHPATSIPPGAGQSAGSNSVCHSWRLCRAPLMPGR